MKMNCPVCNSRAKLNQFVHVSSAMNPLTTSPIEVKDAARFDCLNPECNHSWMTDDQEAHLGACIAKYSRYRLTPKEVTVLREGLPFKTKKHLADFLCLNSKAFIKWERGYTEMNDAYELLFRLAARSKDNLDFIYSLHQKHFSFDVEDYLAIKEKRNHLDYRIGIYAPEIKSPGTFVAMQDHVSIEVVKIYSTSEVEKKEQPTAADSYESYALAA